MNEKINRVLKDRRFVPVAVGVTAFAGGAALGFFLGKRKARDYGEYEIPEDVFELEESDDNVVSLPAPGRVIIDEDALREIEERDRAQRSGENFVHEALLPGQGGGDGLGKAVDEVSADEEVEEVRQNVFAHDDLEWNYEEELKKRTTSAPYMIHHDEFYNDEMGYSQSTLMYYEGDNILADEDDKPIYNHETVVGDFKFGHGSGDPNVVHVRNDKLRAEYEIVRDSGLYAVEVLGLQIEQTERARDLKHSNSNPKFRLE